MLSLDEARAAHAREVVAVVDAVAGLDDGQWQAATRCEGWTVRDLVAHVAWGQRLEANGVAGLVEGRTTPLVPDDMTAPGRDEVLAELRSSSQALLDGLADRTDADLERLAPMPFGMPPLAVLIQVIAMEVGVHASDLHAALGRPSTLAPDVVRATETFLRLFLPTLAAGGPEDGASVSCRLEGATVDLSLAWDGSAWSSVDAAAAGAATSTVTIKGADSDLCLYALGRLGPALDDAGLTVTGDDELASCFRSYFPRI